MVKLVFLSSGVHQVIFSVKSTLPYAVGQVQDVGLIFLSAMATSVVHACKQAGQEREVTQGTVLVTLLLTTILVGVLIILTGTVICLSCTAALLPVSVIPLGLFWSARHRTHLPVHPESDGMHSKACKAYQQHEWHTACTTQCN